MLEYLLEYLRLFFFFFLGGGGGFFAKSKGEFVHI